MILDFAKTTVVHPENALEQLGAEAVANRGKANGYCPLDDLAQVPAANLPTPTSPVGLVPLGAVLAWLKSLTDTPALPEQFAECNGQIINDGYSPYNGVALPNLNGQQRFLRGNSASGASGGGGNHTHTFAATTDVEDGDAGVPQGAGAPITVAGLGHTHTVSGATAEAASALPPFYEVVWIIRIK